MNKNEEKFSNKKYNNRSLLEAYQQVVQNADTEFAQEYEQEAIMTEEGEQEKYVSGALMSTYTQAMDSYQEGTIDAELEASKNDVKQIPREGYDE